MDSSTWLHAYSAFGPVTVPEAPLREHRTTFVPANRAEEMDLLSVQNKVQNRSWAVPLAGANNPAHSRLKQRSSPAALRLPTTFPRTAENEQPLEGAT